MTVIHANMNRMKYIHFSEKGPRINNEDCLNIVEIADKRTLFVVCDGYYQMGTTLVMASIEGQTAHIVHAGDSRCYTEDAIPEIKVVELQALERILLPSFPKCQLSTE